MGYLYGTMTDGIVSSLARLVEVGDQNMTLIQTSVALNSGNSGGALINSYGQVVGINIAKITGIRGDAVVEGIGLAIPITDALPFINHIIHTGTSVRPSLGIMCYEARIDGQKGILVDETTPGTPAAKGLKAGDFIVAANGKLVGRLHELTRILYATGVGNEVKLTVIRGARELIIPIRLYDRLTE
jgi:S1-C subfamily serine protease